jgi:hypothetical protein
MKAFVTYDKSGRVTAVGIPNPELGDEITMVAMDGESVVGIDTSEIVKKNPERLSFLPSNESRERLQEVVRRIVERYRVDPPSK